jgi:phosphoglycolate phosphatase
MLIFWDIDGTLLNTGRAGIFAWQDSLRDLAGVSADLEEFDTSGLPDHGIARRLLVMYAGIREPNVEQVSELVRGYEDRLLGALHRRTGRVLPNVRAILESCAREPGICSLLLTGNSRRGARAKLAHYGLLDFFQGGGFSERDEDRSAIARAALEDARLADVSAPSNRIYVIGDTPHDVTCGAAIGARTVAVATGRHTAQELGALSPWRVLVQLPPAQDFLAMLRQAEVEADV